MSKFSFSSPSHQAGRPAASSTGSVRQVTTAPEAQGLELEFVFLPSTDEASFGGPKPRHHHYGQWKNPNRQGTPLAFWRKVKDTLRYLAGGTYRGNYVAPGPHGRRNNIEPEDLPSPGVDQPGSGREGIAQRAIRRAKLAVPPWPPFQLPDLPNQPSVALQPPPASFRGVELTPEKPISYHQEVLFIEDTDRFVNRATARRVMSDLLVLMQTHPDVQVTIEGNAANDFRAPALGFPYGRNKKLLMKFPAWGIYEGKAYYGTPFRTVGDLMLARARAIGNLLISQGIAPSRVRCSIGSFGYGTLGVPGSGARKRRATIIISE